MDGRFKIRFQSLEGYNIFWLCLRYGRIRKKKKKEEKQQIIGYNPEERTQELLQTFTFHRQRFFYRMSPGHRLEGGIFQLSDFSKK